jgi:hypothetical protein
MKIKYWILTVLFVVVVSDPQIVNAQEDQDLRDKLGIGFKAGINSSNLYDSESEDFNNDPKVGFAFGGFLSIPFGKFLGFQPELMYSQKGYKGSGNVLVSDYEYTRKTDYIDVPLQLQIKPAPFLTILAGPQYSFLVSKGIDFEAGSISDSQQEDIENNDIRKNTLGAVVGLDFNISRVVLSGRFSWDLQHNDGDGTSTSPRYKNVVAQVTLGVRL